MGNVDGPSIVLVTMAAAAVLSNIGAYGPLRLQIAMSPLILSCIALSGERAEGEEASATWSNGARRTGVRKTSLGVERAARRMQVRVACLRKV